MSGRVVSRAPAGEARRIWATRLTVLLCLPTVTGVTGVLIAQAFRPGDSWPFETLADRFFVGLFAFGLPIAMLGMPLAMLAIPLGAWVVWNAGSSSKAARVILLTIALAVAGVSYIVVQTLDLWRRHPEYFGRRSFLFEIPCPPDSHGSASCV